MMNQVVLKHREKREKGRGFTKAVELVKRDSSTVPSGAYDMSSWKEER
jgi:hypothetical protein